MEFLIFVYVILSIALVVLNVFMIVYYFRLCGDVKSIKGNISAIPSAIFDLPSAMSKVTKNNDNDFFYCDDCEGCEHKLNKVAPKPVKRIHASRYDIFEFCHRIKNYDPVYDGEDKQEFIDNMVYVYNVRFFEDFRKYVKD